jgi:hypothetical protein
MVYSQLESTTIARSLLLLLLLLLQALQHHCLKVLAFSTTSFHLTRSWMHLVQLFRFIILKPSFISFSHLIFGLPAYLVDIGFNSYNFWTILSFIARLLSWQNLGLTHPRLPRQGCCANCGLGEPRPLLTRQKTTQLLVPSLNTKHNITHSMRVGL